MSPEMERVVETLFSSVADLRRVLHSAQQEQADVLPALDSAARQEAYVSGVDLGRRAQALLAQHARQGMPLEEEAVLAGMMDAFRQQVRLPLPVMEEIAERVNTRLVQMAPPPATGVGFTQASRTLYMQFLHAPGMRYGKEGALYIVKEPGYGALLQDSDRVALYLTGRFADGHCFEPRGAEGIAQEVTVQELCLPLRHVVKQLRWGGEAQVLIPSFSLINRGREPGNANCDINVVFEVRVKRRNAG